MLHDEVVTRRGWLGLVVVCICLAISALYELLEWWVALLSEEAAEAFLGTQGYDGAAVQWLLIVGALVLLAALVRVIDQA